MLRFQTNKPDDDDDDLSIPWIGVISKLELT